MFTSDEFTLIVGSTEVTLGFNRDLTQLTMAITSYGQDGSPDYFASVGLSREQIGKMAGAFKQALDALDRDGA